MYVPVGSCQGTFDKMSIICLKYLIFYLLRYLDLCCGEYEFIFDDYLTIANPYAKTKLKSSLMGVSLNIPVRFLEIYVEHVEPFLINLTLVPRVFTFWTC